ncbi:Differentiation-associated protein 1 putative isoform 1 [Tripterygium wilfordii]|uniref:Differentiation-associated protein 1 putative isoform 1 n=1 Tax=Tripterygium wilfordii TaxID=458696 RepID=A0A7J7CRG8_TRIWF|nr:uncharacterized protein LOC120014844 [Tripterygium wilfordii]KAF5736559.1 Differentiation-associated protein 1 putative isoform 1 [Tripterygium wilfordii]
MAVSLNSVVGFNSKLQSRHQNTSRSYVGFLAPKAAQFTSPFVMFGSRNFMKENKWGFCLSVANSDQLASDMSDKGSGNSGTSLSDNQFSAPNSPSPDSPGGINEFQNTEDDESRSQVSGNSNGSVLSSPIKQETPSSPNMRSTPKRASLTARERLKAARVLNRYTDFKSSKPEMGRKLLDALKESDKGKKRSRLPEAPTNLFDDRDRGMPKQGLTFQFPGGADLFFIAFSFVFISTVMFATTYIVWKVGAIHFNEY